MESKLEGTVNYLKFIACALDAVKQNEEPQDMPPKQQEEAYLAYLYIKNKKKPPRMTNSTSTDATFGSAWCNRMITKQ